MDLDQSLGLESDTWFDRLILNLATFFFIMIIVLATTQVVVRVFDLPISGGAWWTAPLARYTLIFGTFFGAAVASRNGEHIEMTILRDFIANRVPRLAIGIDLVAQLVTVGFLFVALYAALLAAVTNWGDRLLDIPFNSGYVYIGIGAGLAATALYELYNLYTLVNPESSETSNESAVTTGEDGQ